MVGTEPRRIGLIDICSIAVDMGDLPFFLGRVAIEPVAERAATPTCHKDCRNDGLGEGSSRLVAT